MITLNSPSRLYRENGDYNFTSGLLLIGRRGLHGEVSRLAGRSLSYLSGAKAFINFDAGCLASADGQFRVAPARANCSRRRRELRCHHRSWVASVAYFVLSARRGASRNPLRRSLVPVASATSGELRFKSSADLWHVSITMKDAPIPRSSICTPSTDTC